MLIRPKQALPLAKIYCKLFVFKYIFKMQGNIIARNGLHYGNGDNLNSFFAYSHFVENTILWELQVAKVGFIT